MENANNQLNEGLEQYVEEVNQKSLYYENNPNQPKDTQFKAEKMDLSKRAFKKQLTEVVESSDVILEVLDARDPQACRSYELEKLALSSTIPKKIILILNKIDLVDFENALAWQTHFRREYPTVLFRANTQSKSSTLGRIDTFNPKMEAGKAETLLNTNRAVGADELIQLLKNYCRVDDVKKTITVGIVGFPNVGKSSLVNSLKRSKAVGVSSTPGFTKIKQLVNLDKNIKLLDCPGVVFENRKANDLILKNVARVEDMNAPEQAVEAALNKLGKDLFLAHYKVPDFETVNMFLALVAQKTGKMIKGGIADQDKAARMILKDLYEGKLRYSTLPPSMEMDM